MNESIERAFPGLLQRWLDKLVADINAHPEELVDMDPFTMTPRTIMQLKKKMSGFTMLSVFRLDL
jgi:hypothetical protein